MTEAEWDRSEDPQKMLESLQASGRASDRKFRLFAVACCRCAWHLLPDEPCRKAVDVAEGFADGGASQDDLLAAYSGADTRRPNGQSSRSAEEEASGFASLAARFTSACELGFPDKDTGLVVQYDSSANTAAAADCVARAQAWAGRAGEDLTRARVAESVLLRDLFGPLPFREVRIDPGWLAWNDGTVKKLAQVVYEDRIPPPALDIAGLAVLADALEEASCTGAELLGHLRSPGLHVRGCWVLDLLLGKE